MTTYRRGSQRRISEILQPVKRLDIPHDELIIVGGAALQIFGITVTGDIDIVVGSERILEMVTEIEATDEHRIGGNAKRRVGHLGLQLTVEADGIGKLLVEGNEYENAVLGDISFMMPPHDHLYAASFDELMTRSIKVKDVPVLNPDGVREWKEAVGRDKDWYDIALIDARLGRNAA